MKTRDNWLDIAKGIGIIAVVIGHSTNDYNQLFYWFHMPLFFIISGYLFKPLKNMDEVKEKSKRKIGQLMTPYYSYGLFFILVIFLIDFEISTIIKNTIKLVYGGEILTGYFGVFWFITVLLLTQIFYSLIHYKVSTKFIFFIVSFCYILSQIISHTQFLTNITPPWNLDVVLLSIVYFAIGSLSRSYIQKLFNNIYAVSLAIAISILLIYLQLKGNLNYFLDMKYNVYTHPVLDLLVPLLFSFVILSISFHISKKIRLNSLSYLGSNSLTIMYLHIPLNNFIFDTFNLQYNWIVFSIIGILFPILIHIFIISRNDITSYLFLGQRRKSFIRQQKTTGIPEL